MAQSDGESPIAIQARGLVKKYEGGRIAALDGLDLDVADGEFVALCGPSGCGKSTLLNLLSAIDRPDAGRLDVFGRCLNGLDDAEANRFRASVVGLVFQLHNLLPSLTAIENVQVPMMAAGVAAGERLARARGLLERVGLGDRDGALPTTLSGGERQRVAVGRAIVRTPRAFLFDEPLSNLDARLRIQMRAELKRLHRTLQTTTLYVTHDQEEAMTLGDRIAVMRAGHLHQCAAPLDVYLSPVDRFVAGFIGMPPMNFFDGQIAAHEGKPMFDTGFGLLDLPERTLDVLKSLVGSPTVFGARPESLLLSPADANPPADTGSLNMTVSVIEILGSDKDVYLHTPDGQQVVARVGARSPITEGQQVTVSTDPAQAHVFDPGPTGANIGISN